MRKSYWSSIVAICLITLLAGCAPSSMRNGNHGYNKKDRGTYRGSYYVVNKGDTLYYIAYVTGRDVNKLIRFNELKSPNSLRIGQKIKLWYPDYQDETTSYAYSNAGSKASHSTPSASTTKKSTQTKVDSTSTKGYVGAKQNANKVATSSSANKPISSWIWPTKGRVINNFDAGGKGIDITGQRGQDVLSTASGSVVYSGSALRGYGNLIIVKHNSKYLSAYAHNDRLLVHEGQKVKAGQKIATMGSSGTSAVKLHFEIRYQGKSVNPERYLP
ncbi:peptidoglycan DD-metalloendopeptidase family protein [Vibrio gallicus]|uniref:peptidoglycan DD-metalloendopeptidase family protein n=1 Tax=Vibrio gallicus TaxID=190897 RepID=UPI0021C3809F|nr:peptidoglycan DD-metalloendopeptidase family protein [Vibrio gallicus]